MKYNELLDTLQNLTNNKEIKKSEIAEIIGAIESDLDNRITNDEFFTENELKLIGEHYKVDLVHFDKVNTILESMIKEDQESKKILPDEVIKLNYYSDTSAICGYSTLSDDLSANKIAIPTSIIKDFNKSDVYSIINAPENSISQVIMPDDLLIIKHTKKAEDNKLHIFETNNNISCNYLSPDLAENINIIGVVVASIRKF